MHVSWVSGAPYAYALLRHGRRVGNAAYVDAAEAVLDHIAGNLTPGGTFWPQWTAERGWTSGWHPDHTRLHARTLADATLFMLRAAGWTLVARARRALEPRRRAAHAARRRRAAGGAPRRDGRGGLVGGHAPACRGSRRSSRPATSTRRAAPARTTRASSTWYGAPEDVDLAPTSEDGYAAVMAFVALEDWETATPRRRLDADLPLHLRRRLPPRHAARPPRLPHARRRPGLAREPAPARVRAGLPAGAGAARARDRRRPLPRATRENLACFRQFIARDDGDFGALQGMAAERYYQTDCFEAKGMLLPALARVERRRAALGCEAALELGAVTRFPDGLPLGRRDLGVPDRGLARRRRPRAVDLGHVHARARQIDGGDTATSPATTTAAGAKTST